MIMGYFAPLATSDLHDGRHTHTLAEENGIFQFHGERAGVSLQLRRSACPYHVRHSDRVADQDHIDSRLIDAESLERSSDPTAKTSGYVYAVLIVIFSPFLYLDAMVEAVTFYYPHFRNATRYPPRFGNCFTKGANTIVQEKRLRSWE